MHDNKTNSKSYYIGWGTGFGLFGALMLYMAVGALGTYYRTGYIEIAIKRTFHFYGATALFYQVVWLFISVALLWISFLYFRKAFAR